MDLPCHRSVIPTITRSWSLCPPSSETQDPCIRRLGWLRVSTVGRHKGGMTSSFQTNPGFSHAGAVFVRIFLCRALPFPAFLVTGHSIPNRRIYPVDLLEACLGDFRRRIGTAEWNTGLVDVESKRAVHDIRAGATDNTEVTGLHADLNRAYGYGHK